MGNTQQIWHPSCRQYWIPQIYQYRSHFTLHGKTTHYQCANESKRERSRQFNTPKYIPIITDSISSNTHRPNVNRKDSNTQDKTTDSPAFDLSTKRVEFGNGTARVTTVAYETLCHSTHATLLKSIIIQISALDRVLPSDNHIHFKPYGLLQTTDATTINNQITQQHRFMAQTGIVPILNITSDTMNSGLKERVLAITSVIGLELISFTTKSGKWLVIVKKKKAKQD